MARRKLTLQEQEFLMRDLANRTVTSTGDRAGRTALFLTAQDADDLMTVADTLFTFGAYGADEYVKQKASKKRRTG